MYFFRSFFPFILFYYFSHKIFNLELTKYIIYVTLFQTYYILLGNLMDIKNITKKT